MASSGSALPSLPMDAGSRAAASGGAAAMDSDDVPASSSASTTPAGAAPSFSPASKASVAAATAGPSSAVTATRSIRCPPHRYTPLRECWPKIVRPLVDVLGLQVRFNTKTRSVEMRRGPATKDSGALQKAEDFVRAFMAGFDVADAVALLRVDDLYVESFDVQDVRMLKGEHLSRAVGRVAGTGGKTRVAIENATRTRIVVAGTRFHVMGAHGNIQVARDAICSLILGAPPGKVYNQMRQVAARMGRRY